MQSSIDGLHHKLRSEKECSRLNWGKKEDRSPGIAESAFVDLRSKSRHRPRRNVLGLHGSPVESTYIAVDAGYIKNVRVLGIRSNVSALAAANGEPIAGIDLSR